jgi:hypothetical protein
VFFVVAVPFGVVTEMVPVRAPVGTLVVILVELLTVKVAATPPKVTDVAPVKFVPPSVTLVPTLPDDGVKLEIVGAPVAAVVVVVDAVVVVVVVPTVNTAVLVPVPAGVVTARAPLAKPDGTTAVICVALTTVNDVAATPPKRTAVAPVKFEPVTVTVLPTGPTVGVNEVTTGAEATTVNDAVLAPVP